MADQIPTGSQTSNKQAGRKAGASAGVNDPGYAAGSTGTYQSGSPGQSGDQSSTGDGLAGAASAAASGLMAQVKNQASSQVTAQKDRAAEGLGSVASALRKAGDQLRSENTGLASYTDMAVDELEQFSERLRGKDPAEFVSDLEGFARRRPAAFVGGAFLIGLGLARFLKSSNRRSTSSGSMRRQMGQRNQPWPRATGMSTPPGPGLRGAGSRTDIGAGTTGVSGATGSIGSAGLGTTGSAGETGLPSTAGTSGTARVPGTTPTGPASTRGGQTGKGEGS